ncbi:cation diffusion facilitator family transporter [Candidatus Saccharibacteria bacterium]|nr:cation diffusion facilitator family transporter [Candidatus Saccharibacteria bacterium]
MAKTKKITGKKVASISMNVSISDIVLNLIVAFFTRSTVLLAQALQGLSDLVTAGAIYWGVKRSQKHPDRAYQLGYGREVFFWVLIAGVIMFTGTGGMSFYFGYQQFTNPQAISNIYIGLGMLVIGLISNAYALNMSIRRLKQADPKISWTKQLVGSSLVETKATLLVDFMGTTGAVIGLFALTAFALTGNSRYDGLGSMLIGIGMMSVSILLIRDVGSLIIGRSVDKYVQDQIIEASVDVDGVLDVLDLRTMYIGPGRMLALIEIHVIKGLETTHIEKLIDEVKESVKKVVPDIHHIQVEIETPDKKPRKLSRKIKSSKK